MNRLVVLLGCLFAAGAAVASEGTYKVGPRDVLHVEVFGEPDCTRDVTVSESGTITLPYLGALPVEGRSLEDVVREIEVGYLDGIFVDPQVSVTIQQYRSQPFQVVGAVKQPGNFFVERPISVREALGLAGWIETEKSSRQVAIRRANGDQIVFSTEELGGPRGDVIVQPGDVIAVEEGQWVYVSGEVEKAGEIVFYDGLTVWRALVKAGGPAETARLRRAYLVRQDGERIQVNLKRIRDSKDPDVMMQPGDQLFVHESPL